MAIKAGNIAWFMTVDTTSFNKALKSSRSNMLRTRGAILDAGAAIGRGMLAAGVGMAVGLGAAVKIAADFEQAITSAAVRTGKTGEELKKTKKLMSRFAKTLG